MEILYLLIPLSVVILAFVVLAFLWAVHSGQFEDLEAPAYRILLDADNAKVEPGSNEQDKSPE